VTFADSVLHLVRAGARIDSRGGPGGADSAAALAAVPTSPSAEERVELASTAVAAAAEAAPARLAELDPAAEALLAGVAVLPGEAAGVLEEYEPGLADLEAAVSLVSTGIATRVVLTGFPSWPGLLWRAYQLADATGVLILPTVVRSGGRVDIAITRDIAANG
jgi:hypothetical protein